MVNPGFGNPNYIVPTPPAGDSSNRIATTAFARAQSSPIITIKAFGAKCDGVTDDSGAINASLAAVNYACLPPNSSTAIANQILIGSNQALFGFGFSSVIQLTATFFGIIPIQFAGSNILVANFQVNSSLVQASVDTFPIIGNQNTVNQVRISGIGFNLPTHFKGPIAFYAQSTAPANSDIIIERCDTQTAASAYTLFSVSNAYTFTNVLITENILNNIWGGSGYGIGISLSGSINNCTVSNNVIGNVQVSYVEVVGNCSGINITGNTFFGTGSNSFASTGSGTNSDILFSGNVCAPTCANFTPISSCPGAVFCDNIFYGAVNITCNNVWFHHNTVIGTNSVGGGLGANTILLSGTTSGCIVENNWVDQSGNAGASTGILCNGASVLNNIIRNNLIKISPQSANYTGQINSAAGNQFIGNLFENNGTASVGDTPYKFSVIAGSTYTVTPQDLFIQNNFAGTLTLTLPNPATYPARVLYIITVGNNAVVSASSNVASTSGAVGTSILAATAGKFACLLSDGSSTWRTFASN